eukprot:m.97450 g.97450  ORF g.97450 m.97450 type:complete len:530 (-) comp15222_c0_seq5:52-1641(-)
MAEMAFSAAAAVLVVVLAAMTGPGHAAVPANSSRYNVLYIVVDDLRPNIGAYGHSFMHTPNIDQLAAEGLTFNRAYVQYSYCAPSRNSFMTGRRPDRTRDWNFIDHFREPSIGANWTSMPEYFKQNGYLALGAGKLYHKALPPVFDVPLSWSSDRPFVSAEYCDKDSYHHAGVECPVATDGCDPNATLFGDGDRYCALDEKLLKYPLYDRVNVNATLENLRYAKESNQNFFIGVGLHRPHLPWAAPVAFYDLYSDDDVASPKFPNVPEGMPEVAWHAGINNTRHEPCPTELAKKYRRAYYASVSYMDSLVGELLAGLDQLGFADNTVVALWGDHGWQLGEHNLWKKMTNFELGVRVPLIMRCPWKKNAVGVKTSALAEIVDMYQTLADLAGLPQPNQTVEGISLAPVLDAPPISGIGIKPYAFSQFAKAKTNKGKPWDPCTECERDEIDFMGFSVRSDKWRYTEWVHWNHTAMQPHWGDVEGVELYSHENDQGDDFDCCENVNMVGQSHTKHIIEGLQAQLYAQFQHDQ